jgi:integrase
MLASSYYDGLAGFAHDLRHTYAALMVKAGAHAKYLQAQMGHSSIQVTLDGYGHLFPDANRGVLDALDALVRGDGAHQVPANEKQSGDLAGNPC